jgi:hypothetical protein
MKRLIIFIFTFVCTFVYSQKINLLGSYYSGTDYLKLSDSSMEFKYGKVYGFGTYKIKRNKIVVHTVSKIHDNSSKFEIDSAIISKEKFQISIFNPKSIIPCTTFLTVKKAEHKKEYINWMIDNSKPVLVENFNSNDAENKIVILFNGYDKLKIKLKDILGKSVKVYMTDNKTLMDEKVTFKIINNSKETIISGPFPKLSRLQKRLFGLNHTWPWKKRSHCRHEIVPNEYRK